VGKEAADQRCYNLATECAGRHDMELHYGGLFTWLCRAKTTDKPVQAILFWIETVPNSAESNNQINGDGI